MGKRILTLDSQAAGEKLQTGKGETFAEASFRGESRGTGSQPKARPAAYLSSPGGELSAKAPGSLSVIRLSLLHGVAADQPLQPLQPGLEVGVLVFERKTSLSPFSVPFLSE